MGPARGKKPPQRQNGGSSLPAQSTSSAKDSSTEAAAAQCQDDDIICDSAPAPTQNPATAHDQQNVNIAQTQPDKNTSDIPEISLDTIKKELSINIAKINVVETVIDSLPSGIDGPLKTIVDQVKQLSVCMSVTNKQVLNLCNVKQQQPDPALPPPSSYADALKRTGDTVAKIQSSLRDDQRHTVFEKDRAKAARSFFIPEVNALLSKVDTDLATTGSTRVAKPTGEIVKSDLHWWVTAKAAAHIDTSLLKALPPSANQLFSKVILRRSDDKPTSAIVECQSPDLKNLVCRIIRMKVDGRQTRSNPVPNLAPGHSAAEHDYKTAARVSDAKLQYRPLYAKLNSSSPVVNHTANLIKTVLAYKSYDVAPQWTRQSGKPGQPHHSLALKFEPGPMGPRISLDPDKLICGNTEDVLQYLASQLSSKYPNITSAPAKWSKIKRELSPTIESCFKTYMHQTTRNAKDSNDNNSDANQADHVNE